jgi:hypothetical protein
METIIVIGAVTTVLTAISAILYRIVVGDRETRKLEKLKKELEQQNSSKSSSKTK